MNAQPFHFKSIAVAAFGPSLLFGLGEGAILPVVALSARHLGSSVAMAALIVTLIGVGSLLSNIPASIITLRYGERWAIVGAAAWGALAMLICIAFDNIGAFACGIFMIGMSSSIFGLARQSYLTEVVPVHYRARALSTLGGVMRIGLFIGPFLAAFAIHHVGIRGAYWTGLVALIAAAVLAARIPDLKEPAATVVDLANAAPAALDRNAPPAPAPTLRSVARSSVNVFMTVGIGTMLVAAVRASRQVVIPLWAENIGIDVAMTSLIYGLASAVDVMVFYPAGKLMDRKGRNWVAVPSMVVMGTGLLLLPFTHGATLLLLAALLIGFGNGIGSGMIMTLGADYSPNPGRAHFLGVWRLLSDIGATCGPALLSGVTATLSLAAGIWSSSVLSFAAAGVLWYWIPRINARRAAKLPAVTDTPS